MVQTVNKLKLIFLSISIISIILGSCGTYRGNKENCKLIQEENKIIGNDKGAITLKSKHNNYVPVIIEELLYNNRIVGSNYLESILFSDSKLRAGYSIEGCRDTAWAKKQMASHLLSKYSLARVDSFKIVDTYKYSFIKDSIHLLTPHNNPYIDIGLSSSRGNLTCTGCAFSNFIAMVVTRTGYQIDGDREYVLQLDKDFNDIEMMKNNKYLFKYKYDQKKGIKLDELIIDLQNMYGIILTEVKTDTIKLGYYYLDE